MCIQKEKCFKQWYEFQEENYFSLFWMREKFFFYSSLFLILSAHMRDREVLTDSSWNLNVLDRNKDFHQQKLDIVTSVWDFLLLWLCLMTTKNLNIFGMVSENLTPVQMCIEEAAHSFDIFTLEHFEHIKTYMMANRAGLQANHMWLQYLRRQREMHGHVYITCRSTTFICMLVFRTIC